MTRRHVDIRRKGEECEPRAHQQTCTSAGPPETAVKYSSRSGVEPQKGCAHRPASSGLAVSREGEIRKHLGELGVPVHVGLLQRPQAQGIVLIMRPCGVERTSRSTVLKTDHRGRGVRASHRSSRSFPTQLVLAKLFTEWLNPVFSQDSVLPHSAGDGCLLGKLTRH